MNINSRLRINTDLNLHSISLRFSTSSSSHNVMIRCILPFFARKEKISKWWCQVNNEKRKRGKIYIAWVYFFRKEIEFFLPDSSWCTFRFLLPFLLSLLFLFQCFLFMQIKEEQMKCSKSMTFCTTITIAIIIICHPATSNMNLFCYKVCRDSQPFSHDSQCRLN